jgi:hypothetical protein
LTTIDRIPLRGLKILPSQVMWMNRKDNLYLVGTVTHATTLIGVVVALVDGIVAVSVTTLIVVAGTTSILQRRRRCDSSLCQVPWTLPIFAALTNWTGQISCGIGH